ncbi:Hypothetical predicted protein [Cloeon dipterum]|uniref:Malonyl-CoA decarboxylase C-terminal domain-containing protein n=1 Tax=Cloeon dipterum TaxID=197152 RepID=A0A8S1DRN7_9INSE|nr:Hypothetical predicted protein [Cloeon dipterum]
MLVSLGRAALRLRRAAAPPVAPWTMLPTPELHQLPPFGDDEAPPGAFQEGSLETCDDQDDEQRVCELVKEIFSFRDSAVSNWIVESKVKLLCAEYKCMRTDSDRDTFLKMLATAYSVDGTKLQEAARALLEIDPNDHRGAVKAQEKLRDQLAPRYHWLFTHMGRLESGVKFLVDLRTQVLDSLAQCKDEVASAALQQLNTTLRELLSMWFSVGFLRLERVTWQSPCDLLQKVSEYEAVHPMRGWTDLKGRVGLYRRCFMFTHDSMPREPIVVLHTALADTISSSMKGIVTAAQRLSVDASAAGGLAGLKMAESEENPDLVKAAIFYSITSTQKGLQGIELGNYLIKRVVKELRAEFPLVHQFSSLSPIPQFRQWLMDRLKVAKLHTLFTEEEIGNLSAFMKCPADSANVRDLLSTNKWLAEYSFVQTMEDPFMRLCARYLYLEKRRGFALDSVGNFHLRNGAVMWRLNWRADTTIKGLNNSLGIMVNYRYFLEDAESNSKSYLEDQCINASDQVLNLAEKAKALMDLP